MSRPARGADSRSRRSYHDRQRNGVRRHLDGRPNRRRSHLHAETSRRAVPLTETPAWRRAPRWAGSVVDPIERTAWHPHSLGQTLVVTAGARPGAALRGITPAIVYPYHAAGQD